VAARKTRKPVESEASVLERVTSALERCEGVKVMRNRIGFDKRAMRFYGLGTGSSDVVACVAPLGRWVCCETKRPKGGRVSEEQEKWLEEMRKLGAVVGVCTSPEEAIALVEEARK
jgi:hypothetical protein